ncbi:MAG: VanZ family protein [Clostridia bacterium]|nr:VanZ family protein [Clostridia bacterium]
MARKIRALVFALLALAIVCFIFSNSAQGAEESNEASGWVAAFLRPILDPLGRLDDAVFHKLVRKLAHFVEFGALGVCLCACFVNTPLRRPWISALAGSVLVACCDETIQRFTGGRSCQWQDVCIDSAGAVCGILFVCLIVLILLYYREGKSCPNSDL